MLAISFQEWLHWFILPPAMYKHSSCSVFSNTGYVNFFFIFAILVFVYLYLTGILNFIFLMTNNTLATSCEELTHWRRLWCWEGLGAGGEGDDRGWDGWMASPTWWTWIWVNSRSWWWTGRPGMLQFMGSQRVGHDWVTELNWMRLNNF